MQAGTDETAIRSHLQRLGLSEKQVDTYFAVLAAGEAKASTIAEDAGVSQRYVYNIAEDLADTGLVEVNDHAVPTTVRAVDPEQAIASMVGDLQSIQPALERRFTETTPDSATFDVIKSRQTVLKRVRSLLSAATEEAFVALPSPVVPDVADAMAAAVDRGVCVLLLEGAASPDDGGDPADRFGGTATVVRQWNEDMPFVATVDATSGLVGERRLLVGSHDERQAVSLAQSQIVGSLFGSYVSSFWPMAEEAYVADPVALPLTYTMMRPAVLQAALHRAAGRAVEATVEVAATDGGDRETVTGEVVDVRQGLVEPPTNSFPVENSLVLDHGGEAVSVGGQGAFVEDYVANEVTLRAR